MTATPADDGSLETGSALARPLPAFVDWLLSAIIALAGLALLLAGTALRVVVDWTFLAAAIARGDLAGDPFTDAELLEIANSVVTWIGLGLLLTGVVMVVVAIWYAYARHRARGNAAEGEPVGSYVANAVVGAVTTGLLSFLPLSPAVGGALAGYLEHAESGRSVGVGALSGLLAVAPLLSVGVFLLVGLVAGLLVIEAAGLALVVGAAVALGLLVVGTVSAGLGAVGGYVGGTLAEA